MEILKAVSLAAALVFTSLTASVDARAFVPDAPPAQDQNLAGNILDGIGICDEYLNEDDPRYVECLIAVYGANCSTAIAAERYECKALSATILALSLSHGVRNILGENIRP